MSDEQGRPGEDPAQWPLGRLLSTAARLVERDWDGWLAGHGVTHAGLLALHALQDGPLTQRQVAAASRVQEQTMSRVLDRLQRSGHVTRRRDEQDRRRLVVEATPDGLDVLTAVVRAGVSDELVTAHLDDAPSFRAELVRLVEALRA